jgi:TonB family protein
MADRPDTTRKSKPATWRKCWPNWSDPRPHNDSALQRYVPEFEQCWNKRASSNVFCCLQRDDLMWHEWAYDKERNSVNSKATVRGVAAALVIDFTRLVLLCCLIGTLGVLKSQEISHRTDVRIIHQVAPDYTKEAGDAKIQGFVSLSATVSIDGIASEIKVVRGLGHGLDKKAVQCLQKWRFSPASLYGDPISTSATFLIYFRLPY